ncbi:MAG: caspase family protein [Acidobacteriota bacterium]|nr:caspase family protein [Acidobacteriota bacterium]
MSVNETPRLVVNIGHSGSISSAVFSPDGRLVLSGGKDDKAAILWETATGKEIRRFVGHQAQINSVAFSPDGRFVLTGSGGNDYDREKVEDNTARLWDAGNGMEIRRFSGHKDAVNSVAFSPDGRHVLTGSEDRTARLWETETGKEVHRFEGHANPVKAVAFSPSDSSVIATGGGDCFPMGFFESNFAKNCTARLWNLNTGKEIIRFGEDQKTLGFGVLVFSPDGKTLFTGAGPAETENRFAIRDGNAVVRRWDITTGRQIQQFKGWGPLAVLPGNSLLVGAQMWNLNNGRKSLFIGDDEADDYDVGEVVSIALDPGGKSVLMVNDQILGQGSGGGHMGSVSMRIFNLGTQGITQEFGGNTIPVLNAEFSNNNNSFLAGEYLWDTKTGRVKILEDYTVHENLKFLTDFMVDDELYQPKYSFSPNGDLFVKEGKESEEKYYFGIWDTGNGQLIQKFFKYGVGNKVTFTSDNEHALIENFGGSLTFLNVYTGKEHWKRDFNGDAIEAAIEAVKWGWGDKQRFFSKIVANETLVAVINPYSNDDEERNYLKFIDITTGKPVRQMKYEGDDFLNLSPDGRYIVLPSGEKQVRIYDVLSDKEIPRIGLSPDTKASWLLTKDSRVYPRGIYDETDAFLNSILSPETIQLAKKIEAMEIEQISEELEDRVKALLIEDFNRFIVTNKTVDLRFLAELDLDQKTKQAIADGLSGEVLKRYNRMLLEKHILDFPGSYFISASGFSRDGRYVAIATSGDSVETVTEVFEVETGKRKAVLRGVGPKGDFFAGVQELEFSKDNKYIPIYEPEVAQVWEMATGELISQFRHEENLIEDASFSPDGRFVITGSLDGSARIWKTESGEELCRVITFKGGNWLVAGPDGRFDTNDLEATVGASFVFPDNPFQPVAAETFARDYYEPGLLARLLEGEQFPTIRDISLLNRTQPEIEIKEIKETGLPGMVEVLVEVENITSEFQKDANKKPVRSGVFDLRLFRNGQLIGVSTPTDNLGHFIKAAPGLIEQNKKYIEKTGMLINTPEDAAWREAHDIFTLKAENVTRISPDKVRYTFKDVKLPRDGRGKVEFSAYAFNSDRVKSDTARTEYSYEPKETRLGNTYLVSVGVNSYENKRYDLNYAANDARRMQDVLGEGLKVKLKATNQKLYQIPIVSDKADGARPAVNNATKEVIKGVFSLFAGKAVSSEILEKIPVKENGKDINSKDLPRIEPEDTLIISVSSHGYAAQSGIFYILPNDIGENTTGITGEVLPKLISSDELSLWMRDITAREMLMIVDACHSAASVQGSGFKPGPMGSRGLGQLAYDKGMRIVAATQADDVALEARTLNQGLLSYALITDGIEKKLANTEEPEKNELFIREWLEYSEMRVPELYDGIKDGTFKNVGSQCIGPTCPKIEIRKQRPGIFDFRRDKNDSLLMSWSN